MKVQRIGTLAITIALAGSLLIATPAQAASAAQSDPAAPTGTCWLDLSTSVTQCFKDDRAFKDAVRAQSGTEVVYASASTPTARSGASTQAAAATYVLAIMYWSAGYGGSTLNVTSPYSTLCTAHSYTQDVLPTGWSDQIGSFKTFGTCKVRLSELTFQGGSQFGPYTSRSTLGLMNDQASSLWVTG